MGEIAAATREATRRAKVVAELRAIAAQADASAIEAERRFANAPSWSAAATCAPNARARAAAYRFQADHVEAGTWLSYLASIGRGVATHGRSHDG